MTRLSVALGCSTYLAMIAAPAQAQALPFSIPAGNLQTALDLYVQRTGAQLIYRIDDVRAVRSPGAVGYLTPAAALDGLLSGTGFAQEQDASGAIAIIKRKPIAYMAPEQTIPSPVSPTVSAPREREYAAEPANSGGDIIVTARKRDETSIAVPVTITAITGADLERRGVVSLDNLTKVVPTLLLGTSGGAIQGGVIAIRGIAGGDVNPFADQAVSFNVDGVQVARALVRRLATMDMAQIEVLKGPQALFFGKNSPGGIISIRTADPTDRFQAKASAGYEFNAREWRGDGYVSGPLTDSLGARLAFYGSRMRGWMDNDFQGAGIYTPQDKHLPKTREFALRGTLKFNPSSQFDARIKVNYNKLKDAGALTTQEKVDCPLGVPQLGGGPDECRPNGKTSRLDLGPVIPTLDPEFHSRPYLTQDQLLTSIEMNYHPTDMLTFTSVTGYYDTNSKVADNFGLAFNQAQTISSRNTLKFREFSEELRLSSNFEGPVDFLLGGYYQSSRASLRVRTFLGLATPSQLNNYELMQRGTGYSVFGQMIVRPVETVELTAGGRYSHENKRLPLVASSPASLGEPAPLPVDPRFPRRDSWDNLSPEFTAAYKPSRNLTIFASYKEGFLSGGFNSGASNFNSDLRYDQQTISGFEGGIKAALFDNALRTNLSIYSYKVKGLQVTTNFQSGSQIVQFVTNAGKVSVKGVEADFTYRTPLTGLSLRGAISYNDATYDRFTVNCYRGQTQALGCNVGIPSAAGIFSLQNLAGEQLVRAPKWTANGGFGYQTNVGSGLHARLNVDGSYSGTYYTESAQSPGSYQKKYALLDANIEIGDQDNEWTVALIGRNLTNKYYFQRSVSAALTGSAPGGVTGFRGDTNAYVNRGREIMVRLTVKYGG